jgi:cation diffusion facilitator family transporter
MSKANLPAAPLSHAHVFLGAEHAKNERRTWVVIGLCGAMMVAEILGGLFFGSIALVADGIHMSTHAGALLLAAVAYAYARKYTDDPRFTFGTGKVGDLAGFTSSIILAMIALLIGYESVSRLFEPVQIYFAEAIPIALLGLAVNVASAWLLGHEGGDHDHLHGAVGSPGHRQEHRFVTGTGIDEHEHTHGPSQRDNNYRAAAIHVIGDAAVSGLVIIGLLFASAFGWLWLDPLAGVIGSMVIATWAFSLARDTSAILLDTNPDRQMTERIRQAIEREGDRVTDLHLWRLGPGHLGAIVSISSCAGLGTDDYRTKLARFRSISHLTVEVVPSTGT